MSDLLRLLVVAGVVLALVLGAERERTARAGAQHIDDVFVFTDASLLVRTSIEPPDARALDAIAGMAARTPLFAALPPAPRLALSLPQQLMAGRATGLTFSINGAAGAREQLHLLDDDGAVVDSAEVALDGRGLGGGAFRVRPVREGWHEWTVRAAGETRTVGMWALPERAPRVLIAAGPPGPESRFVARALEETGVQLELRQPLGRGLTAGAAPESLPADPTVLAEYDVVIVLHGARLDAGRRAALERYVSEHGGGVLIGARDPLLERLGLAAGAQPDPRSITADDMRWSLPPELVRLPSVTGSSAAEPLTAAPDALVAAAAGDGAALLVARGVGHGRAAALGLRETWRWRVAGAAGDEHREFWRSVVDWLAPPATDVRIDTPHPVSAAGLPVTVDVEARGTPPPLLLRSPDGTLETLAPAPGGGPRHARLAFLPTDTGVYMLIGEHGAAEAAVRVAPGGGIDLSAGGAPAQVPRGSSPAPVPHSGEAGALLALVADASGGRALPAAELQSAVHSRMAARPTLPWRLPLLLLLLAIATADWAVRRLGGAS
jgi:hypothetical protein